MYSLILIATDGSELSDKALLHGLDLAKTLGAKVTVVHVTEPWTSAVSGEWAIAFPVEEYEKTAAANAQRVLGRAAEEARRRSVPCDTVHVRDQFAAQGIVEEAKTRNCDLIVMASHGRRGFARFLLGSEATRVLTHSPVAVLVVK